MSEISVFLRHAKRNHNTSVDLSHRDLSFIPKQLLTLRNVEHLNLSNNKLECIESSIVELYKLKQLDLSYNLLTEIPVQISSLPMLDKLNLEGNPLSPDFEMLLVPANCSGERLANTLKQCFQREVKSKVSTPEWLIEGSTKNLVQKPCPPDLQWQAELPQPPKQSRQTSRQKKQCQPALNQPVPQFKNNILQIKIEDLEICEQISMGGFSTIHRGNFCGIEVAVKKIFNPNINEDLINQFNNQLMMLSRYRHPHIVLMVGAVTVPPVLCIVMECCRDGTLYDLLHKRKTNLSEKDKTKITTQILQTLNFLHKHGIVHRDLKSHNILLTPTLDIKLCDFGLARHKSQLNTGPMQYSGTPTYMAQELFLKKLYDMSVDVFALGTLLYELYAGEVPYAGVDVADIRERVLKDSALGTKVGVKRTVLQIINRCRLPEPANRPTVEELLKFQDW